MGVRVDEPRHDDIAARIDGVGGSKPLDIAAAVSTATMSRPSTATAPDDRTRRPASIVTTVALVTIKETCRGAA
jgi:hypothetical protein